jgi:hypothetical protein
MFNYYYDEDRLGHFATVKIFENIGKGLNYGYTSDFVALELKQAPEPKQNNMIDLIYKYNIIVLNESQKIDDLANLYIKEGVIPKKYRLDALHIASATVHDLDCLLTFNFKHMIKKKTKESVAYINLHEGYKNIYICTPMEVLDDENQE